MGPLAPSPPAASLPDARSLAREQQRIDELCVATLRALAGERDLHLRGGRLYRGAQALPAFVPHLAVETGRRDFEDHRGAADGMALRLAHSDARLHRQALPEDPIQRLVVELLEQFRVESQARESMRGLRRNLRRRFDRWVGDFLASPLFETQRGRLMLAIAAVARARVCGEPMLEAAEDPIESVRGDLVARVGAELRALRLTREDQRAYAVQAARFAAKVRALWDDLGAGRDEAQGGPDGGQRKDRAQGFTLWMDFDPAGEEGFALAGCGDSRVLGEAGGAYRVFTRAYDREVRAGTLVRRALLQELRERLDARIAAQAVNFGRIARELQALLARPAVDGWDGGQEEGRIDGARLGQLIASPAERRLFRVERERPVADAAVTFLLDCSGSMKAQVEPVAMLVDVLLRALEMAGVPCELLGYTTGAWNGGRALRDWQRAGRPRHPGRLNEVTHLVFKDFDTPWRRARQDIAALLKADLFREGVDGEAVLWAAERLHARSARRRVLLVVSDGSPMDTATHLANDAHYLDQHLREVVQALNAGGSVEVGGIGVGLDLSPYYDFSQALDLQAPPGQGLFREVIELLARRHRR